MANGIKEDLMYRYQGALPFHRKPDGGFTLHSSEDDSLYKIDSLLFTDMGIELKLVAGFNVHNSEITDNTQTALLVTNKFRAEDGDKSCVVTIARLHGDSYKTEHFNTDGTTTPDEISTHLRNVGLISHKYSGALTKINIAPLVNCLYHVLQEINERKKALYNG